MPQPDPGETALEARLLAHRALLGRLVQAMPEAEKAVLVRWLEDRRIPQDGQEDPGAVPVGVALSTLAIADEYRCLLARIDPGLPKDADG